MSDTGPGPSAELNVGFNEAEFRRQAERAGDIFAAAFLASMNDVAGQVRTIFNSAFSGAQMANASRQALKKAGVAGAAGFEEGFKDNLSIADGLEAQLDGLRKGVAAQMRTLSNLGLDKDLFAGANGQIDNVVRLLSELREAQRRGLDPDQASLWARNVETALGNVRANLRETEPLIRTFIQKQAAAQSANTAAMQQETTLQNAILRTSSNEQIQRAQATARSRIEIAKFTFRQIVFIEKQMAAAIRGSIAIVGNITGGIATGLGRIGSLFRRSDRELNSGLNGALLAREGALSRSFRKQTSIIQSETARQQSVLDRFERRSSKGIAGAVTGRSRLAGGLGLGGGLAAATGGFSGAALITQGFKRFTELERLNLLLERLTGSALAGQAALQGFNDAAVSSPFALTDVAQLGVGFISIGQSAEEAARSTRVLLDAVGFVGGSADSLQRVGLAIRQVSSNGRLLGEELNQIAEALPGLNINRVLADRLAGGSGSELRRMREAGEISADAFITALIGGLAADKRIAGAAEDLSNTLGGTAAKTQTAFARLGATIIGRQQDSLMSALKALQKGMDALGRFIEGDVNPTLLLLRSILIGVAKGMAALAAARGAFEVLQFLAIGARALFTPLGLLVATVAALGAAFQVLKTRNPAALEAIKDIVTPAVQDGLQRLVQFGTAVATVFRQDVIPVLIGLGVLLASRIVPLLEKLGNVVTDTVLPALQAVGDAVVSAFSAALPYIEPLVQGFITLGSALGDAFSGDFSTLLDGIKALGTGIGRTFAGIGTRIAEALLPSLQRAAGFISNLFDRIDFVAIGLGVLKVIETIGYALGRIASHPAFVAALAAVAAAAVLVVASFGQGIAKGIADNIPLWLDLIKDGFSSLSLTEVLVGVFGLAALSAVAATIITTFTRLGRDGGGSFIKGFAKSIKAFPEAVYGGTGGLFGQRATEAAARAGDNQAKAYRKAFDNANRDIRALGGTPRLLNLNDAVDTKKLPGEVRKVNAEVARLSDSLGVARARSLLLRDSIGAFSNALRTADVGAFGRAVSTAFRRADFARLGQNAGIAVIGGFGAVLAGNSAGLSGGGLTGILISAIGAGISSGSPFVAAAVAGAGLIAGAIKEIGRESEVTAAAINAMADSWLGLDSLERALSLQKTVLDEALAAGTEVQGLANLLPSDFGANFAKQATTTSLSAQDAFSKLATGIGLSSFQIKGFLAAFGDDLSILGRADELLAGKTDEQNLGIGGQTTALFKFRAAVEAAGGTTEGFSGLLDILTRAASTSTGAISALSNTASLGGTALNAQAEGAAAITQETEKMTAAQLELSRINLTNNTKSLFESVKQNVEQAGGSVISLFELIIAEAKRLGISLDLSFLRNLTGETNKAADAWERLARINEMWDNTHPALDQEAIKTYTEGVENLEDQFMELFDATDFASKAIDQLNEQRTDRINSQIQTLESSLARAEEASERAREAFTDFILGKYESTPQAAVDDFISSLTGVAESLSEASLIGGETGAAAVRSIFGDIDRDIANIIQAGFEAGLNPQQIQSLFDPVLGAIGETVNPLTAIYNPDRVIVPPEIAARITQQLQDDVDTEQIGIGMNAIFNADSQVAAIQRQLDAKRAELDMDVVFSQAQVDAALAAAGLNEHTIKLVADTTDLGLLQGDGLTGDIANFQAQASTLGALLGLAGAGPYGATPVKEIAPNLYQFILAPGNDEASIAAAAGNGIADASVAAGGGIPAKSVIYRPIQVGGGAGIPIAV